MGVVAFTAAHGSGMPSGEGVEALERGTGAGVDVPAGSVAPQPDAASTQAPASTVANTPLTTSPPTLIAKDGQPTDNAGTAATLPPQAAWQFGWSLSCARQITVSQGRPGYADEVTGQSELDSARLRRDLSLALRRRLTVYAGVGATALTVVFTLIAATTAPGKAKTATPPGAQPDPAATSAPAETNPDPFPTTAPIVIQPPLSPPTDAPRPSHHTPPAVVSGGS